MTNLTRDYDFLHRMHVYEGLVIDFDHPDNCDPEDCIVEKLAVHHYRNGSYMVYSRAWPDGASHQLEPIE